MTNKLRTFKEYVSKNNLMDIDLASLYPETTIAFDSEKLLRPIGLDPSSRAEEGAVKMAADEADGVVTVGVDSHRQVDSALLQQLLSRNCENNSSLKDMKVLLKTIVWGIKTVIAGLVSVSMKASRASSSGGDSMKPDGLYLPPAFSKFTDRSILKHSLAWALRACEVFVYRNSAGVTGVTGAGTAVDSVDDLPTGSASSSSATSSGGSSASGSAAAPASSSISEVDSRDLQDTLDQITLIFLSVDNILFRELFIWVLPQLFDLCVSNGAYILIFQQLIVHPTISSSAIDILVSFLYSKLLDFSKSSSEKASNSTNKTPSSTILKLFKVALGSLQKIPDNERFFRPKWVNLISSCLRFAFN